MFNNTNNTKQQGNVGIGSAILYFTKQNYTVSIPLNDSQDYDLIVDINGILNKVQVKTTRLLRGNNFIVCLKSSGGTKGKIYSRVCDTSVDLLFILCADGTTYLIPREVFLKVKTGISLPSKYTEYRIG